MSEDVLLVEKSGTIATVTLNRPDKMNSFDGALRGAMRHLRRCLSGDIAKTTTAQDRLEAQHILLRIRTLTRRTSAQQEQGYQ